MCGLVWKDFGMVVVVLSRVSTDSGAAVARGDWAAWRQYLDSCWVEGRVVQFCYYDIPDNNLHDEWSDFTDEQFCAFS